MSLYKREKRIIENNAKRYGTLASTVPLYINVSR